MRHSRERRLDPIQLPRRPSQSKRDIRSAVSQTQTAIFDDRDKDKKVLPPLQKRKTLQAKETSVEKARTREMFSKTMRGFSAHKKEDQPQLRSTAQSFAKSRAQAEVGRSCFDSALVRVGKLKVPNRVVLSKDVDSYEHLQTATREVLEDCEQLWQRLRREVQQFGEEAGQLHDQPKLLRLLQSKVEELQYFLEPEFRLVLEFFQSNAGMRREFMLALKNAHRVQEELPGLLCDLKRENLLLDELRALLGDYDTTSDFYQQAEVFAAIVSFFEQTGELKVMKATSYPQRLVVLLRSILTRHSVYFPLEEEGRERHRVALELAYSLASYLEGLQFQLKKELPSLAEASHVARVLTEFGELAERVQQEWLLVACRAREDWEAYFRVFRVRGRLLKFRPRGDAFAFSERRETLGQLAELKQELAGGVRATRSKREYDYSEEVSDS